jgi:hypothetical protein
MNALVQLKRTPPLPLVAFVLGCLTLLPVAQAAPPPKPEDRGNNNSAAENVQALNLGTTGSRNTAHGWFSLFTNTTGSRNTADCFNALYSNTTGSNNTATGDSALFTNTTGLSNLLRLIIGTKIPKQPKTRRNLV